VSRVVQFSGGITSWAAARRVADQHGIDDLVLLFADTLIEDEDLHRFLAQAAADIGVRVTRVADGRTPTEVFLDRKFIGNSQIAPCSLHLKQLPCRRWLEANCDSDDTVLYVGIDWTTKDANRLPGIAAGWAPWRVEAPLLQPPYLDKRGWMLEARRRGIEPPRMYGLGFEHNNCGGRCVRGGQGQWAHLLKVFPERFAAAEADERRLQELLATNATHLRDRTDGETKPLPLTELRRRVEIKRPGAAPLFDAYDWGGCGCMTEVAPLVPTDGVQ
jgi:hypothetical protein